MPRNPEATPTQERVRLDKWLWAARVYKTRTLAAQAVDAGQARIDEDRVKPAHAVKIGDQVVVRKGGIVWRLVVTGLSDRRGGAADAAKLYTETPESLSARVEELARRKVAAATAPVWPGRPTKRERRKLQEFLDEG